VCLDITNPISFFVSPLYVKESDKVFRFKSKELRLRDFQYRVYERFANRDVLEVIRVSAPTGAGKTLTLLIPLLVNFEHGWMYDGSIGIYPSRELAEDQMITLYNLLMELGAEPVDIGLLVPELSKLPDNLKQELGEFMKLLAVEVSGERIPVLLMLITSETLHRLREVMEKGTGEAKAHRELLQDTLSKCATKAFRIVFTVPEYAYLISSGAYQEFEKAGAQLLVVLGELRRFLKALELGNEELVRWFRELAIDIDRKRMYKLYYVSREFLKSLAEAFILFRATAFFDEFHLYSGFSLASFISLLFIYMFERGIGKIVISSATPSKPIRVKGRDKDFFELVKELARALGYEVYDVTAEASPTPSSGWVQVRKRTEVKIVPVVLKTDAKGAPAYGVLQRCLPSILEKCGWAEDYKVKQRSMILVDRVAAVLQAAEAVERITGERPRRVCSIKKLFQEGDEDRKAALKEAKLIVGNMAVAFGVDIKGMDLGVVVSKDSFSALQKVGRIGRGEGLDHAVVYLPIPMYKYQAVQKVLEKIAGAEIPYASSGSGLDFVSLLDELYPSVSPDILVRSRAGIFKAVLSMWTYTFATILRLRSEMREELYAAKKLEDVRYLHYFALALRALSNFFEVERLERKLRQFIRKRLLLTPLALYNLYSYRNMAGITVKWRKPIGGVVEEVVDLTTAGRNIPLKYEDGKFWVDQNYHPYIYTLLGIRVSEGVAPKVREALEMLDGYIVTVGLFIDLVEGSSPFRAKITSYAELFQPKPGRGSDRVVGLAQLRNDKTICELPALVIYARDKRRRNLVDFLSAVDSAVPIYATKGKDMYELLGCIYLL